MYTNLQIKDIKKAIDNRFDGIKKYTNIPKKDFQEAISLCLDWSYCSFNERMYKQIKGLPMGSPISPVVANLFMEDFDKKIIETIPYNIPIFLRNMDDYIIAVPIDKVDDIYERFNNFSQHLSFTLEISNIENFHNISFLDTQLYIEDNHVITNWYHKPTWSGRYVHFLSEHDIKHKKSIIIGLVDRALKLSDSKFHNKNLKLIEKTMLENGYPLKFIKNTMNKRILKIKNENNIDTNNKEILENKLEKQMEFRKNNVVLPIFNGLTNKISHDLRPSGLKTIKKNTNTFKKLIFGSNKDKTPICDQVNVVYKIDCANYEKNYIGHTKSALNMRVSEHASDVTHRRVNTALSKHATYNNHTFKFDTPQILNIESKTRKRTFSESIKIIEDSGINCINKQVETKQINTKYHSLIHLNHSNKMKRQTKLDQILQTKQNNDTTQQPSTSYNISNN